MVQAIQQPQEEFPNHAPLEPHKAGLKPVSKYPESWTLSCQCCPRSPPRLRWLDLFLNRQPSRITASWSCRRGCRAARAAVLIQTLTTPLSQKLRWHILWNGTLQFLRWTSFLLETPSCLVLKLQIQLKTKILFYQLGAKFIIIFHLIFMALFAVSFILEDAGVIYIPMKWNKVQCKFSFENMKLPINKAI